MRCPVTHTHPHGDLGEDPGQRRLQSDQRADARDAGEMARDPDVRRVVRNIMSEVEAVAAKLGIELPISIDQRIAGAEKVGEHKTSMLQDLEAGRPMELEPVVGAVVELGERLGVAMPHTRTVYACTKLLDAQSRRPGLPYVGRVSPARRTSAVGRGLSPGKKAIMIRNRWFQLGAALVAMIMIANLQYAWTLFVKPIQAANGWKLSDVQSAFTLFIMCQTWVMPLDGWLIDRIGPRRFITAAGLLCGVGWAGLGFATTLPMLYACTAWRGSARRSCTAARSDRRSSGSPTAAASRWGSSRQGSAAARRCLSRSSSG